MLALLLLYEDWLPFLLAFGYVVVHHGTVGVLEPTSVYNHPSAWEHPWLWALIHGAFISAAVAANIIAWRFNEDVRSDARAAYVRARQSEERFRSAFESAPIGIALEAPSGRFLQVNRSLCEITGYARDELLATDWRTITHPTTSRPSSSTGGAFSPAKSTRSTLKSATSTPAVALSGLVSAPRS